MQSCLLFLLTLNAPCVSTMCPPTSTNPQTCSTPITFKPASDHGSVARLLLAVSTIILHVSMKSPRGLKEQLSKSPGSLKQWKVTCLRLLIWDLSLRPTWERIDNQLYPYVHDCTLKIQIPTVYVPFSSLFSYFPNLGWHFLEWLQKDKCHSSNVPQPVYTRHYTKTLNNIFRKINLWD